MNATSDHVIVKTFAEKHNLCLPLKNQEDFIGFNEKLQADDEFRKEFVNMNDLGVSFFIYEILLHSQSFLFISVFILQVSSLDCLLDRELKLTKSLTNISKKYLSRKVALKYTILRRVPGKSLLKDTIFYDCVLGCYLLLSICSCSIYIYIYIYIDFSLLAVRIQNFLKILYTFH